MHVNIQERLLRQLQTFSLSFACRLFVPFLIAIELPAVENKHIHKERHALGQRSARVVTQQTIGGKLQGMTDRSTKAAEVAERVQYA